MECDLKDFRSEVANWMKKLPAIMHAMSDSLRNVVEKQDEDRPTHLRQSRLFRSLCWRTRLRKKLKKKTSMKKSLKKKVRISQKKKKNRVVKALKKAKMKKRKARMTW